jgi:pyruvate formate lyase activating enzyme
MQISGLQKLTLIDYPNKIACIIFLFGCNFKCGFCHNPNLILPEKESKPILKEEVLDFLKKRKPYIDGVCITGGEPTINSSLPRFIEQIKELGYAVKIDTNGTNPDMISELIERRLVDYIAMDIKNYKEGYYPLINSEADMENIEKSIKIIINSGVEYEFRTTCIKGYHSEETVKKIGQWIFRVSGKKPGKYFLQRFIRRDSGLVDDKFLSVEEMPMDEMKNLKRAAEEFFEEVEVRN